MMCTKIRTASKLEKLQQKIGSICKNSFITGNNKQRRQFESKREKLRSREIMNDPSKVFSSPIFLTGSKDKRKGI
jgi:hypothetical protein